MDKSAQEWLASRKVIVEFLRELNPRMTQGHLEHNAAAIIARLASHDPPIMLKFPEDE